MMSTRGGWAVWSLLVAGLLLHVTVAFTSPGYDDEFTNIQIVTRYQTIGEVISFINSNDVHPPGQYVVNRLLHDALRDWGLVRVVSAVAGYSALLVLLGRLGFLAESRLMPLAVIVFHPTLLMWCTSLRWYGYFTPLLLAAVTLVLTRRVKAAVYWPVLFGLCVAMFYLCYLGLLLGPVIVVAAILRRRHTLASELPIIVAAGLVASTLVIPQVRLFLMNHVGNRESQASGLPRSLAGAAMGLFTSAGFFPLSPASIVGAIATAVLLVNSLRSRALQNEMAWATAIGAASVVVMVATGVAGKPRNLTPLVPLFMATVVAGSSGASDRWFTRGALWLLVVCTALGAANVVAHTDTAKGSWNMPYREVLAAIQKSRSQGAPPLIIACHDPGIAFYARQLANVTVIGPNGCGAKRCPVVPAGIHLVAVRTYRGALPSDRYQAMVAELPSDSDAELRFGRDGNWWLKHRFDPDIPEWYAQVSIYRPSSVDVPLPAWADGELSVTEVTKP